MAVPKKRTSKTRKKMRKYVWKQKSNTWKTWAQKMAAKVLKY